jgi:hypothetical protein
VRDVRRLARESTHHQENIMNDTNEELVPLSLIALELQDVTADQLAKQFADSLIIADDLGRRCVAAPVARELIETEAKRRHAAAESARRREVARKERFRKLAARRPVPAGVDLGELGELLPVQAICGPPEYDGTFTAVPSAADWLFHDPEGGASIGPTPTQSRELAKARAAKRAK